MWPLPPCLLCAAGEDHAGGGKEGRVTETSGEQGRSEAEEATLWEAGGKVVVVRPPPRVMSGYVASSLNNRFWPYSLIRTEAVLSMDDDFRPTTGRHAFMCACVC